MRKFINLSNQLPLGESNVRLYQASENEVRALRTLCHTWQQTDGFWPFDEVLLTLSQSNSFLLYQPSSSETAWEGAILALDRLHDCEMLILYVVPELRGKHLGKTLLSQLIRFIKLELKQSGRLFLEVKVTNQVATKLYESLGFISVGVRKGYYASGEDARIYQMKLDHE